MAQKPDAVLVQEIDDLVRISETLARDAASARSSLGPERVAELRGATTRLGHFIRMVAGPNSQHLGDLDRIQATDNYPSMHSNWFRHVAELAGLAQAVQHQFRTGLFVNMRGLLQAEVFSDFLDMSEHLLREGYKDPAAVLVGAVLEDTLRKRADREGISTVDAKGKNLTIEPLNVALAKQGVYNVLIQKQVTAWADLRNKAAHGQWSEYDAGHVEQMVTGVRKFCADYLP